MAIDSLYSSLLQGRNALLVQEATIDVIQDDVLFEDVLPAASRALDERSGYQFAPSLEYITLDSVAEYVDEANGLLYLPKPMVEISTLTVNVDFNGENGTDLVYGTDYDYAPTGDLHTLALKRLGQYASWGDTGWVDRSIRITGYVAWRPNYRRAWRPISALAGALNNSALSFGVTAAEGDNFSIGMVLRIGSGVNAEIVNLIGVSTDTLTVPFRGDNNNTEIVTALAHDALTPIYVWVPHPVVTWCMGRTATLYYNRRGQAEVSTFDGVMDHKYPAGQLGEDVLDALRSISDNRAVGT